MPSIAAVVTYAVLALTGIEVSQLKAILIFVSIYAFFAWFRKVALAKQFCSKCEHALYPTQTFRHRLSRRNQKNVE